MATYTPNLDLKKPAGTDYVLVGDFNANSDKMDAVIGDLGQLQTTEKTNLVLAINEAKQQGEHLPYIDETTKTWWVWNASLNQYEDSEESAKGVPGVSVTVGTTTTGAAGTQASVSNSGTASDPILNFTIPQGATGEGVPDGGTDGQIIVKSGVSAVWQDQNTVDGIAAIDGNIPLSAARQYSTMPTVTTADNGTIAQYIGTDETTYKTGHWYEVVNGAWQEIVYGDPNSVSYDTQTGKTDAQKTQARTNIEAADVNAFSALYDAQGAVTALGLGVPSTDLSSGSVDVADNLKAPFLSAIGAQTALTFPLSFTLGGMGATTPLGGLANLGSWKELWSGSFSSGTLTVTGLEDYHVFAVYMNHNVYAFYRENMTATLIQQSSGFPYKFGTADTTWGFVLTAIVLSITNNVLTYSRTEQCNIQSNGSLSVFEADPKIITKIWGIR